MILRGVNFLPEGFGVEAEIVLTPAVIPCLRVHSTSCFFDAWSSFVCDADLLASTKFFNRVFSCFFPPFCSCKTHTHSPVFPFAIAARCRAGETESRDLNN